MLKLLFKLWALEKKMIRRYNTISTKTRFLSHWNWGLNKVDFLSSKFRRIIFGWKTALISSIFFYYNVSNFWWQIYLKFLKSIFLKQFQTSLPWNLIAAYFLVEYLL